MISFDDEENIHFFKGNLRRSLSVYIEISSMSYVLAEMGEGQKKRKESYVVLLRFSQRVRAFVATEVSAPLDSS